MGALLTKAISTAITTIVEDSLVPTLTKVVKSIRLSYQVNVEHIGNHFIEYLDRSYKKYSIVNTLAFRNQQKQLKDIYLPLTLIPGGLVDSRQSNAFKVEGFPSEMFDKYKKVLISDTAGMGKSTLSRIMFLSAIDSQSGIPILIELRNLSEKHCLCDEIRDQLGSLTSEFDESLMLSLFQAGGFIFFFDGYDEIPISDRPSVTSDLKSFIERAGNNLFVLTSRYDKSLTGFGDFFLMKVQPLTTKESYQLLMNYDSHGETSELLIRKLKSDNRDSISVFLKNPLLVSLLFVGFDYKPEIPLKMHLFYYQVFEALFNSHDLSKDASFTHEKRSRLDIVDFFRLLRSLGFVCYTKKKEGFSQGDFTGVLSIAKQLSGITSCTEEELQIDLMIAVPLFCQDGLTIRWVHRSFMEYFASEFIHRDSAEQKKKILRTLTDASDCVNNITLLDFYADLDERNFQKEIVLPILTEFVSFVERPISEVDSSNETRIKRRRQFLFHTDTYLYLVRLGKDDFTLGQLGDLLDSIMPIPTDHVGVHDWGEDIMISLFYPDSTFEIVQLILRKYPFLKNDYTCAIKQVSSRFVPSKLYHYTEGFMLSSPSDYDQLDFLNLLSRVGWIKYSFLDYNESKTMVSTIKAHEQVSENLLQSLLK